MKSYLVTFCIRDGDYEYFTTFQQQLDPKLLAFPVHQRDKYILKEVNGTDYEETCCGNAYEDATGYDYRHYTVYSLKEIKPEHEKILSSYGIY